MNQFITKVGAPGSGGAMLARHTKPRQRQVASPSKRSSSGTAGQPGPSGFGDAFLRQNPSWTGLGVMLCLVVGLPTMALGCSAGPTSTRTAAAMVEALLPEAREVESTCALVTVPREDLSLRHRIAGWKRELAAPQRVLGTIRAEAVASYDALLRTVEVPPSACDAAKIVDAKLRGERFGDTESPCLAALSSSLNSVASQKGGARAAKDRIWAALGRQHLADARALLNDPIEAARLVDLSPALMAAALEAAENSENLAENIASNVGWGKGIVKIALTHLAAELLAWSFDRFVLALEEQHLVNPTSVARSACHYNESRGRGPVAQRVLKRAILRLSLTQWTDRQYPADGLCAEMDDRNDNGCKKMRKNVVADADSSSDSKRDLAPTLYVGDTDWTQNEFTVAEATAKKLQEATDFCKIPHVELADGKESVTYSEAPCDFHFISRVASVLLFHQISASQANREAMDRHIATLSKKLDEHTLEISGRVRDIQSEITALQVGVEQRSASLAMLATKNNEMIERLLECSSARTRATVDRVRFAAGVPGMCPPTATSNRPTSQPCVLLANSAPSTSAVVAFCAGDASERFAVRLGGGSEISVDRGNLCNASGETLKLNLQTDGAFDACSTALKPGPLTDLILLSKRPEFLTPGLRVVVVGHADEQPLGADCTSRIGIGGGEGNKRLSERRAQSVLDVFAKPGLRSATYASKGVGSSDPAMSRCDDRTTEHDRAVCNARNRRVSLEIAGPDLALDVARCLGGGNAAGGIAPPPSRPGQPPAIAPTR
jgi:outer membrane protein OmpA-like peptidoglycan-associated protein